MENNLKNNEIWKDIKGYEGLYQISNFGRIKSFKTSRSKYLTPKDDSRGYLQIQLINKDGIRKTIKIHRLVAETFIPNIENKPCVDHINTIKTDNRVENLIWVTYKENCNNPITIQHYKEAEHCKLSNETIEKLQRARMESIKNGIRFKGKTVICLTTGEIFNSATLAGEYYNIKTTDIIGCCRGKRKTCGKYDGQKMIWRYIVNNKIIEPQKKYKFKIQITELEREILIEKKLVKEKGIEEYIKYLIEEDIKEGIE